ncbi:tRNA pseudouridine(55) synthase TruB [Gimesia panareensis]|uniref:tRNA pseudouridine synthase B n=1 Tax=Gimesia panareensis TaxID=2527978 RepID=A0A518A8B0_9PLAN|nr:tRNA pseudouridine(55) synthase TruB [Gimesia panareensis]QDT28096.1 tRNA pseudouridine synthase B [Gimesia panareensis]QDU50962.1 tRNA pseudouridine synthase B [Gimesia panareensis]
MSGSSSKAGLQLSGLLSVNKPQDVTSRQVVNQFQKLVHPARIGHAGTLDPLATGVLVLCIGQATRLIRFVQDQPKEYIGEFVLGKRSDTDDITGEVVDTPDCPVIEREQLEHYLSNYRGSIEQIPPQYSAVHIDGRRAYDLARRGESFEIEPRTVDVYELEVSEFEFPRFQLRIVCGSGTYIRSIGRDLGEDLGVGATMTSLVRTRIGEFNLDSSLSLEKPPTLETITAHLQPPIRAVPHLPHYQCDARELRALRLGQKLTCDPARLPDVDEIIEIAAITPDGDLVAIAEWDRSHQRLSPRQVYAERSQ